jgi:hypothetical protein
MDLTPNHSGACIYQPLLTERFHALYLLNREGMKEVMCVRGRQRTGET